MQKKVAADRHDEAGGCSGNTAGQPTDKTRCGEPDDANREALDEKKGDMGLQPEGLGKIGDKRDAR